MARIGRYKVSFNRNANAGSILMNIIMLIIWLGVGDVIINSLSGIMNVGNTALACGSTEVNAGVFCQTYSFMGLRANGSTGIIAIVGILLAVGVLIQAFRVTRA